MSIPNENNAITYTGNGSADTFGFEFEIWNSDDLRVVERDTSGVETVLTLNVDYTIAASDIQDPAGGDVVLTAGNLATGYKLLIARVPEQTQLTVLSSQGPFQAKSIEDRLDQITAMIHSLSRYISPGNPALARALLLGETDTDGSGAYEGHGNYISDVADPVLPQDVATRAWVLAAAGGGSTTLEVFTTGTRPTAIAYAGRFIILKDPTLPAVLQCSAPKADDSTYEWSTVYIFMI